LQVYQTLVDRRLAAKAAKNKPVAESLKIVANGSFGKLGSPWSVLYSPDLMIQVTITGQLSLLMFIEALELAGIPVVSANTDGVVMNVHESKHAEYLRIVAEWEARTGFVTEETEYRALYSRDVNTYLAVKLDSTTKGKGAFANPWKDGAWYEAMKIAPSAQICVEAVERYLVDGVPLAQTIRACDDVRKFVIVRRVKSGGVKRGEYLGKAIRYYFSAGDDGEIVYASNGNRVPDSDGARPLMSLPQHVPSDVDFARYVERAERLLVDIGAR
jgi:hypothetical protein